MNRWRFVRDSEHMWRFKCWVHPSQWEYISVYFKCSDCSDVWFSKKKKPHRVFFLYLFLFLCIITFFFFLTSASDSESSDSDWLLSDSLSSSSSDSDSESLLRGLLFLSCFLSSSSLLCSLEKGKQRSKVPLRSQSYIYNRFYCCAYSQKMERSSKN